MHLADLALEVQLHILRFSSPQDLTILSRVHSSLRDAAEYVLYNHIDFNPGRFISWDENDAGGEEYMSTVAVAMDKTSLLLSTLASNARKASTVKAFYIDLDRDFHDDDIPLILVELAGVLKKMVNLVDLRIKTREKQDRSDGKISKVIRSVFNLFPENLIRFTPIMRLTGEVTSNFIPYTWTVIMSLERSSPASLSCGSSDFTTIMVICYWFAKNSKDCI